MQTLFIISAVGIGAMIAVRLIEMKYERMFGLSNVSVCIERRLKPYAKKWRQAVDEKREAIFERIATIPESFKRHGRNASHVAGKYADDLHAKLRGKRSLQRGSVSFFLLNIADTSGWKQKETEGIGMRAIEESRDGGIENEN